MIHVVEGHSRPGLPGHRRTAAVSSIALHVSIVAALALGLTADGRSVWMQPVARPSSVATHLIFIAGESPRTGGGGGGGGNRQPPPIRRAEAVGTDAVTVRVAKPQSSSGQADPLTPVAELVLDAKPLASGHGDQLGLPAGGVTSGTSLGPGFGGGVGEGIGTGIGSGRGSGYGEGSGGGTGGGAYRAGGLISSPRLIREVKPTYTDRAMVDHIEGSVVLELIVRSDGVPANIRVVHALDPDLDRQAIDAATRWRFEPGRLNGVPVDVVVSIQMDFHLR